MPDTSTAATGIGGGIDPIALAKLLQQHFAPVTSGAQGLLSKLADPGGIYDPAQDLAAIRDKRILAQTLPTEADLAARNAGQQAQGADYLAQQLQGVQVPQEGMIEQPNLPQLQLPDQPKTAPPQVNPLAQLLAIGAGFAHPQGAGGFNAAVLEGSLKAAEEENQRRQQVYRNDVAGRAMLYDASMSAAKERQRITEQNKDAAFRNTVANTDKQLMLAKANTEKFTAHGAADNLKAFAEKYDPALKARDEVKSLLDEIDIKGKASSDRIKSVSELLTALHKEDNPNAEMAKDVFNKIMEGVMQGQQQKAADIRQQKHDATVQTGEMARTNVIQQHEDKRTSMNIVGRMNQMLAEQNSINKRFQEGLSANKIPQTLKESQDNQARLQAVLKTAENSKIAAESDLASIDGGATIAGMDKHNGGLLIYRNRLDSAQKNLKAVSDALKTEQQRAIRLSPRAKGPVPQVFDPTTGAGVTP